MYYVSVRVFIEALGVDATYRSAPARLETCIVADTTPDVEHLNTLEQEKDNNS